jgi:hypothetical protein
MIYQTARAGFCPRDFINITGPVHVAYPTTACSDLYNGNNLKGAIVIVDTGNCSPQDKIRNIQRYGAIVSIFETGLIFVTQMWPCQILQRNNVIISII